MERLGGQAHMMNSVVGLNARLVVHVAFTTLRCMVLEIQRNPLP